MPMFATRNHGADKIFEFFFRNMVYDFVVTNQIIFTTLTLSNNHNYVVLNCHIINQNGTKEKLFGQHEPWWIERLLT